MIVRPAGKTLVGPEEAAVGDLQQAGVLVIENLQLEAAGACRRRGLAASSRRSRRAGGR